MSIRAIHDAFLEAGADIIETNTFNATRDRAGRLRTRSDRVRDINLAAAKIARECADAWTAKTPDKPRFVAGALGPTNRTATISPDVNDPGLSQRDRSTSWSRRTREAVDGLVDGGVDLLLVETVFDTLNAKAALFAIDAVFRRARDALAGHRVGHDHRRLRAHVVRPDDRKRSGIRCATRARWPWASTARWARR